MPEEIDPAVPVDGTDGEISARPVERLTRKQRQQLRTVFDADLPSDYRDLFDRRYPFQHRPDYPVPAGAGVAAVLAVIVMAFGHAHLLAILIGAVVFVAAGVIGLGPNLLLRRNERREKRIYDTCSPLSVPAEELVAIAKQQPDLGALIWRMQQAVDGVYESEAWQQQLLAGIVTSKTFTNMELDLVDQIRDLADERALLSQADGRPALDEVLRPRREAAASWLATITASVEQLESVFAEVALLDERLDDVRIAEQILGDGSSLIRDITATASEPGGLDDAAASVRAVREFVAASLPLMTSDQQSIDP